MTERYRSRYWIIEFTGISRSRCQATNTTGNDVIPEATTPEFLKSVTWFWTSRHRWPSISRSHSRATDSFREIGLSLSPVRKFALEQKSSPDFSETGRSSLRPRPLMLILSRDYMQIHRWQRISRSRSGMTNFRKWRHTWQRPRPIFLKSVTWFEQADTADQVYRGLLRVRLIVSEKSAFSAPVRKFDWSKNHPRKTGRSSLSDHAHLC